MGGRHIHALDLSPASIERRETALEKYRGILKNTGLMLMHGPPVFYVCRKE
ncbi:hypothetical protein ALO_00610 [Acetonema longum DSM 6540]|uniref:Uncharacterized protein n=1 Tax=Acetonema longum DSM 6540 TaxID=1009370 RepID=F7NDL5_9FIRM|nr:hypothetical protein ALO_00610 [Acetonema longum DSM 6540]